jgi:hypothetical protein
MQDTKRNRPAGDGDTGSRTDDAPRDRESGLHAGDRSDPDGWQQYRKWISTAPAPRTRRSSVDPTLYTWKGYRSWTEQIKRNWSDS